MTFSEYLAEIMKHDNLTMSELVSLSGLSVKTIKGLLFKGKKPTLRIAEGLAKAFGVPPEFFVRFRI